MSFESLHVSHSSYWKTVFRVGDGGRPIIPFYVAEQVCNAGDLGGKSQVDSCVVDYELTKVCQYFYKLKKNQI